MPSTTQKQQRFMALAYTSPQKVKRKNRGVLRMGRGKLRDFMRLDKGTLDKRRGNLRDTTRRSRRQR